LARELLGGSRILLDFPLRRLVDERHVGIRDHGLLDVRIDAGAPAPESSGELELDARPVLALPLAFYVLEHLRLILRRVDQDADPVRGLVLGGARRDHHRLTGRELRVQTGGTDAYALLTA